MTLKKKEATRFGEIFFSESQLNQLELSLDFCGQAKGLGAQCHYRTIKKNDVLHYIVSGSGVLEVEGTLIPLQQHDCFLLPKNKEVRYWSDQGTEWEYYWIGLSGVKISEYLARTTLASNFVISSQPDSLFHSAFFQLINTFNAEYTLAKELLVSSQTYLLLHNLIEEHPISHQPLKSSKDDLIKKALLFIENNYGNKLTIPDIAAHLHISRGYLHVIFSEKLNRSPINFLTTTRLHKSSLLLNNTSLTINEIAQAVGFTDPLYFSKSFSKHYQMSPTDYRKKQHLSLTKNN